MQLYTKIFIGMALGIVMGLSLGPRAPVLRGDLLVVRGAPPLLLSAPGAGALSQQVPRRKGRARGTLRFELLAEQEFGGARYFKLGIKVDAALALADPSGQLRSGQRLEGWVAAEGLSRPVSALGERITRWIAPIGEAFVRLIMMVVVPLVFASLVVGVASLGDPQQLGRLGAKTLGYFLVTTMLATTIGLVMVHLFRPGQYLSATDKRDLVAEYGAAASAEAGRASEQPDAVANLLAMIPRNPVAALARGRMLQIIFFAGIFGLSLTLLGGEQAKRVVALFEAINDAMVKLVELVMKLAPYGVFALVMQVVGGSGVGVLKALLAYTLVVIAGLMVHLHLVYLPVAALLGGFSPRAFLRAIRPAQLIAFSTSSSSATLPVTMECAEKNLGVPRRISAFVLPIGSTVNMDGTALYQGVAAVFVAQVFDIPLSLGDQLSIVLSATLASIGAAGVPGVGMVTLAMVLSAIHVPAVGVALILGADRVLDMFRTAVNVSGDLTAAVVLARRHTSEGRADDAQEG